METYDPRSSSICVGGCQGCSVGGYLRPTGVRIHWVLDCRWSLDTHIILFSASDEGFRWRGFARYSSQANPNALFFGMVGPLFPGAIVSALVCPTQRVSICKEQRHELECANPSGGAHGPSAPIVVQHSPMNEPTSTCLAHSVMERVDILKFQGFIFFPLYYFSGEGKDQP